MVKINVLLLGKHLTALTETLGSAGRVHLVHATAQSESRLLKGVDRVRDIRQLERLSLRCRNLVDSLEIPLDPPPETTKELPRQFMLATLNKVERQLQAEDEAVNTLIGESGNLLREATQLSGYPFQKTRLEALRHLSHLYIATGRISPTVLPDLDEHLKGRGVLVAGDRRAKGEQEVVLLSSRKNRWAVDTELGKAGFKADELPSRSEGTVGDEQKQISARTNAIARRIQEHQANVLSLRSRHGEALAAMHHQLHRSLAVARAQQYFGQTAELFCMSGWIPAESLEEVMALVDETTQGTGVVEVIEAHDDERVRHGLEHVPVQFQQSTPLKPFQQIVSTFGAPRYNEVEPSPFVALSFVIMFGIMFGDVGQGALVALLGLWIRRTSNPSVRPFRDGGLLLIPCGISAVVFGLLYGSVFGYENPAVLKPLWLNPIHDVTRLLVYTVAFGVVAISVGICLNIVNKMRTGQYFEGVFHRFGVLGIVFYWGALGIGLKAALRHELKPTEALIVVVVPLFLLFIREPLHNFLRRGNPFHGGVVTLFVEACVETMETLTAFLGSTVSFVRIGVMALSHACLCLVTYEIANVLREMPGGGLWALLVIAAGNVVIIALEGMIAMIQALRLQYYELFSKFFSGDGVPYTPFQFSENAQTQTQPQGDTDR